MIEQTLDRNRHTILDNLEVQWAALMVGKLDTYHQHLIRLPTLYQSGIEHLGLFLRVPFATAPHFRLSLQSVHSSLPMLNGESKVVSLFFLDGVAGEWLGKPLKNSTSELVM